MDNNYINYNVNIITQKCFLKNVKSVTNAQVWDGVFGNFKAEIQYTKALEDKKEWEETLKENKEITKKVNKKLKLLSSDKDHYMYKFKKIIPYIQANTKTIIIHTVFKDQGEEYAEKFKVKTSYFLKQIYYGLDAGVMVLKKDREKFWTLDRLFSYGLFIYLPNIKKITYRNKIIYEKN